jgi:hypothetical protein
MSCAQAVLRVKVLRVKLATSAKSPPYANRLSERCFLKTVKSSKRLDPIPAGPSLQGWESALSRPVGVSSGSSAFRFATVRVAPSG